MFDMLLIRSAPDLASLAVYQLVSKGADGLETSDLEALAEAATRVSQAPEADSEYLAEEITLSLYTLLTNEDGTVDKRRFAQACDTATAGLDAPLESGEIDALFEACDVMYTLRYENNVDLRRAYERLSEALGGLKKGRYLSDLMRRRFLDAILRSGAVTQLQDVVRALSGGIAGMDGERYRKVAELGNEFPEL